MSSKSNSTNFRQQLDDPALLKQRDGSGMLEILSHFPGQVAQAPQLAVQVLPLPPGPAITRILFCGLGGSAIGADLLLAYLGQQLAVPAQISRGYQVPSWVNDSTLAVVTSYSGNTEETLASFRSLVRSHAQIVCLSSGGRLSEEAAAANLPCIRLPSGLPPRTAIGYTSLPVALLLSTKGLIEDPGSEINGCLAPLRRNVSDLGPDCPTADNRAKQLALKLRGRLAIVYGSHHRLDVVARRWAGQICENAKQLAYFSSFPEMVHNELVGWRHPRDLLGRLTPIFLRDPDDHVRIARQTDLVRDTHSGREVLEVWGAGKSRLERLFGLVQLGDYASVYLALLNAEDPTPVAVIDDLKRRLKRV